MIIIPTDFQTSPNKVKAQSIFPFSPWFVEIQKSQHDIMTSPLFWVVK